MLVRELIPAMNEALIFPLEGAPLGVRVYDKFLNAADAQGRCDDRDLRADVLDSIGAGHIIVLPPHAAQIIAGRMQIAGLKYQQLAFPNVARTLGYKQFWPQIADLILLVAPHARTWGNEFEAWLGPAIDALLSHWLPFADKRIKGRV